MKADKNTCKEVIAVIEMVGQAYKRHDLVGVMSHFSETMDIAVIGTGKNDQRYGLEQLALQAKRDFKDHPEGYSMLLQDAKVDCLGDVAWFVADCCNDYGEGKRAAETTRLTAVLVRQDGTWKLVQWHKSLPTSD